MSGAERSLYSQIVKAIHLLLVVRMQSTSVLFLPSKSDRIMHQERLSALMTMNVHKDLTDPLDLANKFSNRRSKFIAKIVQIENS